LFEYCELGGNPHDFYNPDNRNLIKTIETKKELPISLVIIYMLVGYRLGLKIAGSNIPGHFLARVNFNGESVYVDCYDKGKTIKTESIYEYLFYIPDDIEEILINDVTPKVIYRRVLRNLYNAYKMYDEKSKMDFFSQLMTKAF